MIKNKLQARSNLRIFGGSSHPALAKAVARKCGVNLGEVHSTKFANNEISVDLKENVRGQDIYVIQTGGGMKPNDDLMELMFLINAFKLASIKVINVIIPYFFYSKGDQKDSHKRVPITAKLVADLLRKAGASHVMIIEPHTPQLEGFFGTPVDALKVEPLFCEWIKKNIPNWKEFVVVAPDEGSTKRCTSVANDLNLEFAMINNRKPKSKGHNKNHRRKRKKSSTHSLRSQKSSERELEPSESDTKENNENGLPDHHPKHYLAKRSHLVPGLNRQISVAGSVAGRNVILIDDMIDTGHTLKEAIETLRKFGASGVHFLATHGIFSGSSIETILLNTDFIRKIVVTNTVPQVANRAKMPDILQVIDISGLVAEYIRRHHYRESVQVLCHFMPTRDEESSAEEELSEEEKISSDDEENENETTLEGLDEDQETIRELNLEEKTRLMQIRKGFRLSSMCWDD